MKPFSTLAACVLAVTMLAGCGEGSSSPRWAGELEYACDSLAADLEREAALPSAVGAGDSRGDQYVAIFQSRRTALRQFSDRLHRISAPDDEEVEQLVVMADELSQTLDLATEHVQRGGVRQALSHLQSMELRVDRVVRGAGVTSCLRGADVAA